MVLYRNIWLYRTELGCGKTFRFFSFLLLPFFLTRCHNADCRQLPPKKKNKKLSGIYKVLQIKE